MYTLPRTAFWGFGKGGVVENGYESAEVNCCKSMDVFSMLLLVEDIGERFTYMQ